MPEKPSNSPAVSQNDAATRWFDRLLYVGTFLAVAVALSPNLPDPDLWGHVEYARDALRFGLPATTTYSYTAIGYPWVNHELLAEFLQAVGMQTLGPIGMLVAKCLLGLGCVGLMALAIRRQQVSTLTLCMVTLLVAMNLTYFWCLRPQLLTFVSYTLLLAVLGYCFEGWQGQWRLPWPQSIRSRQPLEYSSQRMRWLWLVPVIFVFWTNSHGGFVAGIGIFAAYLGGRGLELIAERGRASSGLLKRFTMMFVAVLLVTFLNPYGPGLHTGLWRELGAPRPEIIEWRPPELLVTYMLPFWILVTAWICVLFTSTRPRDFTQLLILTCTLEQSLAHRRHIPFFALAFGFWMAPHVDSTLRRFGIVKDESNTSEPIPRFWKYSFGFTITLTFAIAGFQLLNRLSDMPVQRDEYPVCAFQYVADRNLQGKMVVTFNWAQYALAAFGQKTPGGPGVLLHADGRFRTCYPQELIDMHFDFALSDLEPRYRSPNSPPLNPTRILEYGEPDLVLVSRGQACSVNAMFRSQDRWTLLYQDKVAQVWGRASKYADPNSPSYIPAELRQITNDKQTGSVTWPALPKRSTEGQMTSHPAGTQHSPVENPS